jgi:hypothetical protein
MTRAAPTIIAAVAALALAVAPAAALAKPAGGGGKTTSDHCKPGAVSVDENGKVYAVCNKNGNWVKVIRMTAPDGTTQTMLATAQGPIAGAGS